MNIVDLYDRLLLVYLCSTFNVDIGKRIYIENIPSGRFSLDFNTFYDMVHYLEEKKYIKPISENGYIVTGLRDKYLANCIRKNPRECFTNKEIAQLYLEVITEDCCLYIDFLYKRMDFKFKVGSITKSTIRDSLKYFSCAQVYSIIHRATRYADDDYRKKNGENPKVEIPKYAIRCVGATVRNAVQNNWKIEPYNRPGHLRHAEVERFLCLLLKIDGFNTRIKDLVGLLNQKPKYKYYCTGNSNIMALTDFKEEVKGRLLDFKNEGSKLIYAIYEVEEKIPVDIFKKYNMTGKMIVGK